MYVCRLTVLSNLLAEAYGQPTAAAYGQPPSYEGYGAPAAQETTGYVHLQHLLFTSLVLNHFKARGILCFLYSTSQGKPWFKWKGRGFLWY